MSRRRKSSILERILHRVVLIGHCEKGRVRGPQRESQRKAPSPLEPSTQSREDLPLLKPMRELMSWRSEGLQRVSRWMVEGGR